MDVKAVDSTQGYLEDKCVRGFSDPVKRCACLTDGKGGDTDHKTVPCFKLALNLLAQIVGGQFEVLFLVSVVLKQGHVAIFQPNHLGGREKEREKTSMKRQIKKILNKSFHKTYTQSVHTSAHLPGNPVW